jgi:PAS domain S-box-containing protein
MWVFDPQTFKFAQVNKAAIALYGYTEEEFLEMSLMDIKIEEDIPKTKISLRKPDSKDNVLMKTVKHRKKSGEIIEVEIYSTPITINDKLLRSVIAIDVTEKNLYEHKIVKAIIKTQEDERYEIGGELHDNVCQILATSQMSLGMLEESLSPAKIILFDQVMKYIKLAIDEIRNISHRLAPAFFDDTNLEEAFGRLLDSFNIGGKYKVLLHFNDAAKNYPANHEVQLNLYRILQEQLRNILKYSNAALVEVQVIVQKNKLKMRISDDGVGFDLATVKRGIGLANIKRRTELFYGSCEINSSPGKGCEIIIAIPLPELN